jgi:S-adenosyl-L-methionine hydrolase (adenosine-forming)
MSGTVLLITDYGTVDHYAAALVGACLRVDPTLRVEHGTHGVPFGDVLAGAYSVAALAADFPAGTVICAVVDPGVGSARASVAIDTGAVRCVAPDTGLVHWLWEDAAPPDRRAVRLPVAFGAAPTFHGRDVFAPAAAALAAGADLGDIGEPVDAPRSLGAARVAIRGDTVACRVAVVDRFGNAVTTLRMRDLGGARLRAATWHGGSADRVVRTYAEIGSGVALLVGGSGHVELASDSRSAARAYRLRPGDDVTITIDPGASA